MFDDRFVDLLKCFFDLRISRLKERRKQNLERICREMRLVSTCIVEQHDRLELFAGEIRFDGSLELPDESSEVALIGPASRHE